MCARKKVKLQPTKKVIIRLYRQFDLDLIYLYTSLTEAGCSIQELLKKVLRHEIYGVDEKDEYEAETINTLLTGSGRELRLHSKVQMHLLLDRVEDKDIDDWLTGIRAGYRNAAVKNTVRAYLGKSCIYPVLNTTKLIINNSED